MPPIRNLEFGIQNSNMQWQEKIAGGKLVAIEVEAKDGKITFVRISGDFFLHPEGAIRPLENAAIGLPLGIGEDALSKIFADELRASGAELIGATPADLARIFRKAVS